jgi:hypothetical protein
MILSKRERYIVIGTVIAAAALATDRFALSPLLSARNEAEARKKSTADETRRAHETLKHAAEMKPRWQQMVHAGIINEPSEAESQVLHAIRDWAEASGVTTSLLKSDRLTEKTSLPQIAFQAAGVGSMESITRLLWRIENASIPIRITELQLSPRKEGTDDLTIQLRFTTVYETGPAARPATRAANASSSTGASQ